MNSIKLSACLAGLWMLALLNAAPTLAQGPSVALKRLFPNLKLNTPVFIAPLPGSPGLMILVEKPGRLLLLDQANPEKARVFSDLRKKVNDQGWEEGLLSAAFHPEYLKNGWVFVAYTASRPRRSVISRLRTNFKRKIAPSNSEKVILEVEQPYANHNGGYITFGPDGYLYIGLGDGGWGGDPHGNGQNRNTLLGAILRIDINSSDPKRPYLIPPDNPFTAANAPGRPEIWAYGLRNPWRFNFDFESGAMFIADVGQNSLEEVNRGRAGANYGWNLMEGSSCYGFNFSCNRTGLEMPISEYGRDMGISITGGYVYRGDAIPSLQGRYVFGDFGSGVIWSIPAGVSGLTPPEELLDTDLSISSFGLDAQGELLVIDLKGGVYQLIPAP